MAKLFTEKNPVIELNHVNAVRSGEIKAQYKMSAALAAVGAQQGMLLAVDDVAKEVGFPADADAYVYLHASEEQLYESHLGREDFILESPKLPRMYKLTKGDIFETNCVELNGIDPEAGGVVGLPNADGYIHLAAAAAGTESVVLSVVEEVKLPNGKDGIKFVVTKA